MRKRITLFVLLACGILGVGLLPALFQKPEPSYGGYRLSQWVIGLNGECSVVQATALDAIGTNAVPFLLEWLRYDTPKWKAVLLDGENKVRRILNKKQVQDQMQILG